MQKDKSIINNLVFESFPIMEFESFPIMEFESFPEIMFETFKIDFETKNIL